MNWPYNPYNPPRYTPPLTGPQPGSASCCDSCRIVARAVALLAYALDYPDTGDEITLLLAKGDE